jgi:hypothetical protein
MVVKRDGMLHRETNVKCLNFAGQHSGWFDPSQPNSLCTGIFYLGLKKLGKVF